MKIMLTTAFFTLLLTVAMSTSAQETITLPVEDYNPQDSKNQSQSWAVMKLESDNLTQYTFSKDDTGNKVIKAVADNAGSGLIYKVDIDPKKYQKVTWRWKIRSVLEKGDLRKKDGDDYPARIYITFDYDKSNLSLGDRMKYAAIKTFTSYPIPLRSINYIWANKAKKGTIAANPFTDWVQMIAVQSGNNKAGMWISESRNIYKDYKEAFGEEPPKINGIAIMTDADNTGTKAVGYYGDIIFMKNDNQDSGE